MAINNQTLQEKEFLQRIHIRTMKKDLKQLREADALKEREKISKIEPVKFNEVKIPPTDKLFNGENPIRSFSHDKIPFEIEQSDEIKNSLLTDRQTLQNEQENIKVKIIENEKEGLQEENNTMLEQKTKADEILEQISRRNIPKERPVEMKIKEYADEKEKQQIFLLESQKIDLENQIKKHNEKSSPSLTLEKNQILTEQRGWQKKLAPLVQEEEKNEAQQKMIEDKEMASNIPQEKQNLEKERWALEDKRQDIEKKRWFVEGELSKLEDKIKNLDESYKKHNTKEDTLRQEIVKINDSLRTTYSNIAQRENAKKDALAQEEYIKKHIDSKQEDTMQGHNYIKSERLQKKEYLKEIPIAAKEKLLKSSKIEEQERRKFIEDVEKWAKEVNKDNANE